MTQENKITNEESQKIKMEVLEYSRTAILGDWSARKRNKIMKGLVDKVIEAFVRMPDVPTIRDLRIEISSATVFDYNYNWRGKKRPYNKEKEHNCITEVKIHDNENGIYKKIEAQFAYHPTWYSYRDRFVSGYPPGDDRNWRDYRSVYQPAHISGTIKYNPKFFKKQKDVGRLRRILRK